MLKIKSILIWFLISFLSISFVQSLYAQSSSAIDPTAVWSNLGGNVSVNTNVGSPSSAITIEIPQGRAGVQPSLQIKYGSGAENGIFGVGWNLELGSIQRSTKFGIPQYNNDDQFIMAQSGQTNELVVSSGTIYKPKIEASFVKIEHITSGNDYWVVTDKSDTKYYFGQTLSSREYDSSNTNRIYKWCLDRVEDVNGNFMTFTYFQDTVNNKIYPDRIDYTGHVGSSLPTFANIKFEHQLRNDTQLSYRSGMKSRIDYRIYRIDVNVAGQLLHRYDLNYIYSDATKRSLISSVKMLGSDGTSQLPSTTYTYYNEKGFQLATGWNIPADATFSGINSYGGIEDHAARLVDINGDGYTDILKYLDSQESTPSVSKTYLNNRANGWTESSAWKLPTLINAIGVIGNFHGYGILANNRDQGVRFIDLNGDNKLDVVQYLTGSFYNAFTYKHGLINQSQYISNTDNVNWFVPQRINFEITGQPGQTVGDFYGTVLLDINADGFNDVVYSSWLPGDQTNQAATYINKLAQGQEGWNVDANWRTPNKRETSFRGAPAQQGYSNANCGTTLVDLNGDGLPDFFHKEGGGAVVHMNVSQNWQLLSNPWDNTFGHGNLYDGSTEFADINGDNLVDLIIAKGDYSQGSRTLINTGYGWYEDPAWALPEANFTNMGSRLLDANGDGMTDLMVHYSGQVPKLYLNVGKPADLLKSVENGVGGKTTIEYGSSTNFSNNFLPFSFPVVVKTTQSDALTGNNYTTRYDYAGGLWAAATREFRGFATVKVFDPNGNYSQADYLQGEFNKGAVGEVKFYDASGNLFSKIVNTWDLQSLGIGSNFLFLKRKDNYVYDGNATGRRSAEEYFYGENPQLGNITKVDQLGEVDFASGTDTGSDKRSIETTYNNNVSGANYLAGLPSVVVIKDNAGQIVRKTWFDYDGQNNTALPVKGLLTKKTEWLGDAPVVNPVTQYAYDTYGNLTSTINPLGKDTAITYDSTYRLFPVTVKNTAPINHTVTNEYYGVNVSVQESGFTGLWGQLKLSTDSNNQSGKKTYDVFGRMKASVSPLDSLVLPTMSMNYDFGSNFLKVSKQQRIKSGQAQTINSYDFYDGLGRLLYTKTPSSTAGQYTVSGLTEYDVRGLPIKKYTSYFSNNPVDATELPINSQRPHITVSYDPLGRVKQSYNFDGITYSSVEYDDWSVRTTDENGHMQESLFDAYGRLMEKREYAGADGRAEAYMSGLYPATTGPVKQFYTLYAATKYEYDSEGNLTKTIADAGNKNITTIINYDHLGRKISMDDPDMGFWQYEYDLAGNLMKQTDAKGQVLNFTYDEINRLKNKADQNNTLSTAYTYDDPVFANSKGRLTKASYGMLDATQFKYDVLGREIMSTKTINGTDYGVSRNYDALNRLTDVQYPDANNTKVFYKYNSAGQVQAIANNPSLLP